jgi:DNA mismatch repair endonuclease MutH
MKSYTNSTKAEIISQAQRLIGKTIEEIAPEQFRYSDKSNKGIIGNLVQEFGFGMKANSLSEPDFSKEKIELKIIPLIKSAKGYLRVKERTKIGMINYHGIIKEQWNTSHALQKLNEILFIAVEHHFEDVKLSRVLNAFLYKVEDETEYLTIKNDWERTQRMVADGKAHMLSESQNQLLAPSRAGSGSARDFVTQPNSEILALKRAFSLKPTYTNLVVQQRYKSNGFISFPESLKVQGEDFVSTTLRKLNEWKGRSMYEFMIYHGIKANEAKNRNASILRSVLGIGKNSKIKEFEAIGLTVKVTPRRKKDNKAFEQMSFPFQPFASIIDEEFEESQLRAYLECFIFIPLISENKGEKNPEKITFGESYFWKPSIQELAEIKGEWEWYRNTIREGIVLTRKATRNRRGYVVQTNLPKKSQTKWIHMRPHARDGSDFDKSIAFNGEYCVKMSFWMNM